MPLCKKYQNGLMMPATGFCRPICNRCSRDKISAQFTRKQCQWTLVEEYFFSPPEWAAFA